MARLRNRFLGLSPGQVAKKIWWRAEATPFTYSFARVSLMDEGRMGKSPEGGKLENVFFSKIDRWIKKGNVKKARFWLYEAYKRARVLSPRRAAPLAMRLAEIEGNPFDKLEPGLSKIMLTFAYASLDMQLRFTRHLKEETKGELNKYGESIKELDGWANTVLCESLANTQAVKKIYSEELKSPVEAGNRGYVVTLDPLDGSSNIESKNIFGSILGVYKRKSPGSGREIVASALALYGPVFTIAYSAGEGVHELVKDYGEMGFSQFEILHENIELPEKGKVYGIGGKPSKWEEPLQKFYPNIYEKYGLTLRYSGAFVADFMQVLHKGGLFAYPPLQDKPQGKLRLLYECIPLSFIIEQAGGLSWDGRKGSILDVPIKENMDQRVGLYLGNKEIIKELSGGMG